MVQREEVDLELLPEVHERLTAIQRALGHDELEETIGILTNLGVAAIGLTTKEEPVIHLFTREASSENLRRNVSCPECKHEFIPHYEEDGGYRETSVRLA